jgi:hypothetical protein
MTLSGRFALFSESNMQVYLFVLEEVLHPETYKPILSVGDLLAPSSLLDFNVCYGIDNVKVKAVVAETHTEAAAVAYAP